MIYDNFSWHQAFLVKCDSGITPLNKTAAYDVEVYTIFINKYGEKNKCLILTISILRWSNCR